MKKIRMIVALFCLGFAFEVQGSGGGGGKKESVYVRNLREKKEAENAAAAETAQRKKSGGRRKSEKPSNEAKGGDGGGGGDSSRSESPESGDGKGVANQERKFLAVEDVEFVETVYKDYFSEQFASIQEIIATAYRGRKEVLGKKAKMAIANRADVLISMSLHIRKILEAVKTGSAEEPGLYEKVRITATSIFRKSAEIFSPNIIKAVSEDKDGISVINKLAASAAWGILNKMFDIEDQRFAGTQKKQNLDQEKLKNTKIAMEIQQYTAAGVSADNAKRTVAALYAETNLQDLLCIRSTTLPASKCSTCCRGYNEITKKWHVGYLPLACGFSGCWSAEGYSNGMINNQKIPAFTSYATFIDALRKIGITVNVGDRITFKNYGETFEQELTSENDWNIANMFRGYYYKGYETIFTVKSSSRGGGRPIASQAGMSGNQGMAQGDQGGGKKAQPSRDASAVNNMLAARLGGGVPVSPAQVQPVQPVQQTQRAQVVQQTTAVQPIQQAPVLRGSGNPVDDLLRLHQMLTELNRQAQSA